MLNDSVGLLFRTEFSRTGAGSVELEFIVLADPQWSKKKEEIKSLDLIYKAAWKTIVR